MGAAHDEDAAPVPEVLEDGLAEEGKTIMGLDIHLYRYDDIEAVKQRREAYEQASTEAWSFASDRSYGSLTEQEKESARATLKARATELGLNEDGDDPQEQKIEQGSRFYPDHMFKVGYFRSSYNESGFNRVMPAICGVGLDDLFPGYEDYEFQPDWADSRQRAIEALEKAKTWLATNGAYRIRVFSNNMFSKPSELPDSTEAALARFTAELDRRKINPSGPENYSNNKGTFFFGKALEVVAVIEGIGVFKEPCAYAIYKADDSYDWYLQALEIVIETCEYVLDQPDKEKYWLHWSS